MVDRSGSMSGWAIKFVKDAAIRFGKTYFNRFDGEPVNLNTILFNHEIQPHSSKKYQDFEAFMESNCVASGGTFFGAPLDYIDKILKNPLNKISDL